MGTKRVRRPREPSRAESWVKCRSAERVYEAARLQQRQCAGDGCRRLVRTVNQFFDRSAPFEESAEHLTLHFGEGADRRGLPAACNPDLRKKRANGGHDHRIVVGDQAIAASRPLRVDRPGTAYSSRPMVIAAAAVRRAPDRSGASTTTTASDSPAMIRLRRAKSGRPTGASMATSLTSAPPARTISRARPRWRGG